MPKVYRDSPGNEHIGTAAAALQARELGRPFSSNLIWQFERDLYNGFQRLSCSRQQSVLSPDPLQTPSIANHPHAVAIVPSPDAELIAFARSDAVVELHQPGASTYPQLELNPDTVADPSENSPPSSDLTLRLQLIPRTRSARASDLTWMPGKDTILLALEHPHEVWAFDLETCAQDRPSNVYRLPSHQSRSGATGLCVLESMGIVLAASLDSQVHLVDPRQRNVIRGLHVPTNNNVLACHDSLFCACGEGFVRLYDARKLPAPASRSFVSLSTGIHVHYGSSTSERSLGMLASVCVDSIRSPSFNSVKIVDCGMGVAFQTADGTVGRIDFTLSDVVERYLEIEHRTPPAAQSGLRALGVAPPMADAQPWHVARRKGSVVRGQDGRTWRVIAPCVGSRGFRIVPLGLRDSLSTQTIISSADGSAQLQPVTRLELRPNPENDPVIVSTEESVACLQTGDDLQRVIAAFSTNGVAVYEVALDR